MDEKVLDIIQKIFGILGYDIYDAFIKVRLENKRQRLELKAEHEKLIKNEILNNEKLTIQQKIALNAVLDKNLCSFMREINILNIALDNINDDANANNLDGDWLLDFFDKVSRITEKNTQIVWGKMLALASSDNKICSKTLLNTLYLMSTEDISSFLNVCRFVLTTRYIDSDIKISSYPIIFFSEYFMKYNMYQLSTFSLNRLERFGLIEVDYQSEYVSTKNEIEFVYSNHVIKVVADKIRIGNVRFTYDGYTLYQITDKMYDNSILNKIIEIWIGRNYLVYIDGRLHTR